MLIVGAGGLACQLIDSLQMLHLLEEAVFFDNINENENGFLGKFPVIKSDKEAGKYFANSDPRFCLAVGNPGVRDKLFAKFTALGAKCVSILSPGSKYGQFDIEIGDGTVVLPNGIIESTVKIGKGVLVNVSCSITHGSRIGDFCEFGPGSVICGNVNVGSRVIVGAGAILLPGIKVGDEAIVGAGAVVTKDVLPGSTVMGVPAKASK